MIKFNYGRYGIGQGLLLETPEVEEHDHFGKPSYRVKKKIFATLA
jgi:hypothetical protein